MKLLKPISYLIILSTLIVLAFFYFDEAKLTVENAEFNSNFDHNYPSNCFIKFENKKYLIKKVYKYKHKILNEYWFIASEGFAVQKFNFPFLTGYSSEQKEHKVLNYKENENYIKFNSQEYKIAEKRKDTIISKVGENNIILFIDEK